MLKAVFFDRDGTLTRPNPDKIRWRDAIIRSWSGKPFTLSYDKMAALFQLAARGQTPWYQTLDNERAFTRRYYRHLLEGEGVTEALDERAEMLFNQLWCSNDRLLYDEVEEVLVYFQDRRYRMGVISDTSPSLELSLRQLGVGDYFSSFTASSLVGAGKPDPRIYRAALEAQGVTAAESLYVDDCREEADGARRLGLTAFHLDREGRETGPWVIRNLRELAAYVEKAEEDGKNG